MGLFSSFNSNSKKVSSYEYEKSGGVRSRIMSRLSGSWKQKERKMAELESAVLPSMEHGGKSSLDDGLDASELKHTMDTLRERDQELDLNEHDMKAAEEEFNKKI